MADDYISRSDAVLAVYERVKTIGEDRNPYVLSIRQSIIDIPAADVAPVVHARWEEAAYAELDGHGVCLNHYPKGGLVCTNCLHGWKREKVEDNLYCPLCGAKMDR